MRAIALLSAALLFGLFVAVYGALLLWNPSSFLKFHDTFVDRSRRNRTAAWRKDVYSREYKGLGLVFLLSGVFFAVMSLIRLLSQVY